MDLRKLRRLFVELKLYYARTASYLSILNFLMIVLIFLSTTLWDYAPIQTLFQSKKIFLTVGVIFVLIFTFLIGWLDTHLKLWRTESELSLAANRTPMMVPMAFQSAKILTDLKQAGVDTSALEAELDSLFERCGLKLQFEKFKQSLDTEKNKKT
ncbi:MAG: hypothetical protein QW625_00545 [Candidatus Nanoarchaeia archaeon]